MVVVVFMMSCAFQDCPSRGLRNYKIASASQWVVLEKRMVQAGMEAEAAEYLESFQAIVVQQKALVARMRKDLEACESMIDGLLRSHPALVVI